MLEGSVLVGNGAGVGTFTEASRAPGKPTPLLAAPDISALPDRLERLPIAWPLPAVAGAVRYHTSSRSTSWRSTGRSSSIARDADDAPIVRATMALAHELGIMVVGEGVETEQQRLLLAEQKFDVAQEILYGRPKPGLPET